MKDVLELSEIAVPGISVYSDMSEFVSRNSISNEYLPSLPCYPDYPFYRNWLGSIPNNAQSPYIDKDGKIAYGDLNDRFNIPDDFPRKPFMDWLAGRKKIVTGNTKSYGQPPHDFTVAFDPATDNIASFNAIEVGFLLSELKEFNSSATIINESGIFRYNYFGEYAQYLISCSTLNLRYSANMYALWQERHKRGMYTRGKWQVSGSKLIFIEAESFNISDKIVVPFPVVLPVGYHFEIKGELFSGKRIVAVADSPNTSNNSKITAEQKLAAIRNILDS